MNLKSPIAFEKGEYFHGFLNHSDIMRATILRKLQDVKDLDYPMEKLGVLIVYSASTDRTAEIVKDFMKKTRDLNIRLVTQRERNGKGIELRDTYPLP